QLVALARAYLADPDIIVLDEATSAVDPAADVRLQQAIDGLARGRTTITIAHRLSTAERADQIMVLDDGDLVEHGTHDELVDLEDGIYAGLHRSWIAHRETCLRSRSAGWVGPLTADTGPRAWTRVDQGSATGPCLTRTPGPACVAPAGAPRAWHRTGPKIRTVPDPQHPPVPPVSRRSQPRFRSRERRAELAAAFTAQGPDYDRLRPGYPAQAIDAILTAAGPATVAGSAGAAGPATTAIDLGAGTGKLTLALAARGLNVAAV